MVHVSKNGRLADPKLGSTSHVVDLSWEDISACMGGTMTIITGCPPSGGRYGETFRRIVRIQQKFYSRRVPTWARDQVLRALSQVPA